MSYSYRLPLLICFSKIGITEPFELITLPNLTIEKFDYHFDLEDM